MSKKKKKDDDPYNKYLDMKVDKAYKKWQKLHTREKQEEIQNYLFNAVDSYKSIIKDHLSEIHGKDATEGPKKLNLEYTENEREATKKAQQLISRLAKRNMEQKHGKSYAKDHAGDHQKIEGYVVGLFKGRISYDQLVKKIASARNLMEDDEVKQYLSVMAQEENKDAMKIGLLEERLNDIECQFELHDRANKYLEKEGYHFRKHITNRNVLNQMRHYHTRGGFTSGDIEDRKNYFKKYKKDKKK